jgi:hypothetical protein
MRAAIAVTRAATAVMKCGSSVITNLLEVCEVALAVRSRRQGEDVPSVRFAQIDQQPYTPASGVAWGSG